MEYEDKILIYLYNNNDQHEIILWPVSFLIMEPPYLHLRILKSVCSERIKSQVGFSHKVFLK